MDLSQREGRYPPPPGTSAILGVEFSGHITELGPDVIEWQVNDEVYGLAAGVSTPRTRLYPANDGIPATTTGRLRGVHQSSADPHYPQTGPSFLD